MDKEGYLAGGSVPLKGRERMAEAKCSENQEILEAVSAVMEHLEATLGVCTVAKQITAQLNHSLMNEFKQLRLVRATISRHRLELDIAWMALEEVLSEEEVFDVDVEADVGRVGNPIHGVNGRRRTSPGVSSSEGLRQSSGSGSDS